MGDYAHIRGHITLKEELIEILKPRFSDERTPWEDLDLPESIKQTDAFRMLTLSNYGDCMPGRHSEGIVGFHNSPYGEETVAESRMILEGLGLDFYAAFKHINTQYAFIALLPHIADDWHVEMDWHQFMLSWNENPHAGWTEWDSSKDRSVADAENRAASAMLGLLSEQERNERIRLAALQDESEHPNVGTVGHIDHGKSDLSPYVIIDSLSRIATTPSLSDGRVVIDTSHGWDYMGRPPAKGLTDAQRAKNKLKRKQQAKSRKKNRK